MIRFTDIDTPVQRGAWTIRASLEHDATAGTPWDNDDGHGPVSEWTTRDKMPGELILCENRFYDFAEACRIARRDEWGTLGTYRMALPCQMPDGAWLATATDWRAGITIHGEGEDINEAIRAVYAAHRATFPSARAYAAAAARADYERLRAWCNDEWSYMGVVVTVESNGHTIGTASLWGIESDADAYLLEVANELIDEALENARETVS